MPVASFGFGGGGWSSNRCFPDGIGLVSCWSVTSFSSPFRRRPSAPLFLFLPQPPHSLSFRPSLRGETRTAASAYRRSSLIGLPGLIF